MPSKPAPAVLVLANTLAESSSRTAQRKHIPSHLESKVVADANTQLELDFLRAKSAGKRGWTVLERARQFGGESEGTVLAPAKNTVNGREGGSDMTLSLRAMAIVDRLRKAREAPMT